MKLSDKLRKLADKIDRKEVEITNTEYGVYTDPRRHDFKIGWYGEGLNET